LWGHLLGRCGVLFSHTQCWGGTQIRNIGRTVEVTDGTDETGHAWEVDRTVPVALCLESGVGMFICNNEELARWVAQRVIALHLSEITSTCTCLQLFDCENPFASYFSVSYSTNPLASSCGQSCWVSKQGRINLGTSSQRSRESLRYISAMLHLSPKLNLNLNPTTFNIPRPDKQTSV
jgi:hypothetical protein